MFSRLLIMYLTTVIKPTERDIHERRGAGFKERCPDLCYRKVDFDKMS